MEKNIRENAELTIKMATELGVELTYDEASVAWLDGYIERNRLEFDEETILGLVNIFGSFLGECIRHQYGGQWVQIKDAWAICFTEENCVFPFTKVSKHFENGAEDSILSLFTMIPILFKWKTKLPSRKEEKMKKRKKIELEIEQLIQTLNPEELVEQESVIISINKQQWEYNFEELKKGVIEKLEEKWKKSGDSISREEKSKIIGETLQGEIKKDLYEFFISGALRSDGELIDEDTLQSSYKEEARGFYEMGMELYSCDDPFKAIECLEEAVAYDPTFYEAWANLGALSLNYDSLTKALDCLDKALELDPNKPKPWYNKGLVYLSQGELSRAIECFEKALEIKPDYQLALEQIAIAKKKVMKAANVLTKKGQKLLKRGKLEKALDRFEEALKLVPKHEEALEGLKQTKLALKKKEKRKVN